MARGTEFLPAPIPESGNPRLLPDANRRLESVSDELSSGEFPDQRFTHHRRHKTRNISTEPRDLLDNARAQISVFLFRHQKNRFHARLQFPVHQRHLKLEFEIGNRAQAADDSARFLCSGKLDQQPVELRDPHHLDLADGILQKLQAFLERKERLFLIIVRNGHNHFIEQFSGTLDHIEMSIGHGIEAAWINRASHARKFAEETGNEKPQPRRAFATFYNKRRALAGRDSVEPTMKGNRRLRRASPYW